MTETASVLGVEMIEYDVRDDDDLLIGRVEASSKIEGEVLARQFYPTMRYIEEMPVYAKIWRALSERRK